MRHGFIVLVLAIAVATEADRRFLQFDDYLRNSKYQGWVTVYHKADRGEDDSPFVFSALASPESASALLETLEHEVHSYSFGKPTFVESDGDILFEPNNLYHNENVRLEPFVITRNFHDVRPNTSEIVQSFVLYHNLSFDHDRNAYVNLAGDKIVRISHMGMHVRETELHDYLAARKMILVLYYDHYRWRDVSTIEMLGKAKSEMCKSSKDFKYCIESYPVEGRAFSRFLGKKIIRPSCEPLHEDYAYVLDGPRNYETYALMENNKRVEKSCDMDSGSRRYLTRVYFNKKVLSKYHDSRLYTVRNRIVYYLDSWCLCFGENEELIYAWLGDLGQIPHAEQIHWKLHNEMPRGGLVRSFERRELLGAFEDNRSKSDMLLDLKSDTNTNFERCFGFMLFNELPPGNDSVNLHDLTTGDEREFDEQILNMAKIFVESINEESLNRNITGSKPKKSIKMLERFLADSGLARNNARNVAKVFIMIQEVRDGAAHQRNERYKDQLKHFGLDADPRIRFDVIASRPIAQLRALNAWLERQPRPK